MEGAFLSLVGILESISGLGASSSDLQEFRH